MIRQVDGKKIDLYKIGNWLHSKNHFEDLDLRPSAITLEIAREAIADHYDYTGLQLDRPQGLRFPENPEHVKSYHANLARRQGKITLDEMLALLY